MIIKYQYSRKQGLWEAIKIIASHVKAVEKFINSQKKDFIKK